MKPLAFLVSASAGMHALEIVRAATQADRVDLVFFYQDGVQQANANAYPTQGQSLATQWTDFLFELRSSGQPVKAIACVTSALERGIVDSEQAERLNLLPTLADGFELGGLGQLADALANSKVVTIK